MSIRRAGFKGAAYVVLLLLCAAILLPVGWMVTVALKPDFTPVFTLPRSGSPPSIGIGRTSPGHCSIRPGHSFATA